MSLFLFCNFELHVEFIIEINFYIFSGKIDAFFLWEILLNSTKIKKIMRRKKILVWILGEDSGVVEFFITYHITRRDL